MFTIWSTTATLSSVRMRNFMDQIDSRLKKIYARLYKAAGIVSWQPPEEEGFFLVPVVLHRAAFDFNALATGLLIVLWIFMAIAPLHRKP